MIRFISQRVALAIPVLFGVSVTVFVLVHLAPGDPVATITGITPDSGRQMAELRHQLGLDQPWPVQYAKWLGRMVRGDLGTSLYAHAPVRQLIGSSLPVTLELAGCSLAVSVVLGLPLGVVAALRRGRLTDHLLRLVTVVGVSMPVFWLGLLLIIAFALKLGWLPAGGSVADLGWRALVLPTATLSASFMAVVARITRATVLEVISEDFIRTARAKGLSSFAVYFRHALGNALIPVVTVIGLQLGTLLSGAVLTETIFGLPGLGRLMVNAVSARDYPLILGGVCVIAALYVTLNVIVDLTYGFLDPRIRRA